METRGLGLAFIALILAGNVQGSKDAKVKIQRWTFVMNPRA